MFGQTVYSLMVNRRFFLFLKKPVDKGRNPSIAISGSLICNLPDEEKIFDILRLRLIPFLSCRFSCVLIRSGYRLSSILVFFTGNLDGIV